MRLAAIEATNFRNLSGKIEWGPRLNILYGNNGQGKTNWLEAIHVLARTKSFRTQRLQETIRFGEDLAVIRGNVTTGADLKRDLQITLQDNSKTIFVNSKREALARFSHSFKSFLLRQPIWKWSVVCRKRVDVFWTVVFRHYDPLI
jgi:DNA replication and repair protein RecF